MSSPKIFVAGHRGMVGSAVVRKLKSTGLNNIVTKTRKQANLLDCRTVDNLFAKEKFDYVSMIGTILAGGYYVPINKDMPLRKIHQVVKICGANFFSSERHIKFKSNIKSTSLLANVLIKNKAYTDDAYEALLLRDEYLTEGSASNVFIVGISSQIKYPKNIPKTNAKYFNGDTRETSENLKDWLSHKFAKPPKNPIIHNKTKS